MKESPDLSRLKKLALPNLPYEAAKLVKVLEAQGAEAYIIGGTVRDVLINKPPKDMDIEVARMPLEKLSEILQSLYPKAVDLVGKNFGVFKLRLSGGVVYDITLPRTESKSGRGRKGFISNPDPNMTLEQACARRDFTVSSMVYRPATEQFFDYYGGLSDLEKRILRRTSIAFVESPERALRMMQLAARLGATVDPDTAQLARLMLPEADTLEKQLVWEEWVKWTRGEYPSLGLAALEASGWITVYPEINALVGLRQDKRHHPEGDVFTHTKMVLDHLAMVALREGIEGDELTALMLGGLAHDFGKANTTRDTFSHYCSPIGNRKKIHRGDTCDKCDFTPPAVGGEDTDDFSITSYEHQVTGVPLAKEFMVRIQTPKHIALKVEGYVRHHMDATLKIDQFINDAQKCVLMEAEELHKYRLTINLLEMLVESDASGRHPAPKARPMADWLPVAFKYDCLHGRVPSIVTGDDLINLGMEPGPEMGSTLEILREAQLRHRFFDKETGIKWAKKNAIPKLLSGADLIENGFEPGNYMGYVLVEAMELQVKRVLTSKEAALKWALETQPKNQKEYNERTV